MPVGSQGNYFMRYSKAHRPQTCKDTWTAWSQPPLNTARPGSPDPLPSLPVPPTAWANRSQQDAQAGADPLLTASPAAGSGFLRRRVSDCLHPHCLLQEDPAQLRCCSNAEVPWRAFQGSISQFTVCLYDLFPLLFPFTPMFLLGCFFLTFKGITTSWSSNETILEIVIFQNNVQFLLTISVGFAQGWMVGGGVKLPDKRGGCCCETEDSFDL